MLERIAEIQGIGLLHQANGKPYTCQKATLIYADNGRGKSTLTTILRSVSTGDASLISARKTLDGALPAKVALQFGSGHKVTFTSGSWSETRPEVLVFDADFIERNVHSGGTVTTGHRKNLLEFALGEAAVSARAAVEKTTGEAKTASEKVQNLVAQLSGHHVGLTLAQFEKLHQVVDLDIKLVELQKRISAAGNVTTIVAKPVPAPVPEPSAFVDDIFAVLRTSLEDVHAGAEKLVRKHIEELGNKAAESWLSQGRQFDDTENCPYCGQDTATNELIKAYKTHFNAAYADLKAKVAATYSRSKAATDPNIVGVFSQGVATGVAQAASWSEHVQTQPIQFDAEAALIALTELQTFVVALCQKKQTSPAEPIGSITERDQAAALWNKVVAPMQAVNLMIKTASGAISSYKGQLTTDNVQQLQQEGQKLQATKRRFDSKVVGLIGQLATARTEAETAEKAKTSARDSLDTLMKATLDKYEKSINSFLKSFGASFSIKGMGANFRGAAPRSEYGLSLRGKDVPLEGGPPSFATALSEGDKRTLAFAFFVASTLADPKLVSRTVVIDDPMSSLDVNRKHQTKLVLKKIHAKAEQIVVLAHDPYFIRDIRDALRKDDNTASIAAFQIALSSGEYSDFSAFDVDKECESEYFQRHRLLNDFSAGKACDARSVANAIRPMLEGYLHRRFPSLIPTSLMFGQVVSFIRDAATTSPLSHASGLVDVLTEINDYAGQFHHDPNPGGADSVAITASELKTFVDRALVVVHKGA
ncbi:MAG: AAA family ATPase [Candidatus Dechloromonas phosphoritropha]|jgi:wobble nucleotide-excising tRNase